MRQEGHSGSGGKRHPMVRPAAGVAILAAVLTAGVGCAPQWVYTFVQAENRAKPAEKPILVLYRNHLEPDSTRLMEAVNDPRILRLTEGMVRCSLVSDYQPNRLFVQQYGVTAPPALIVIHPDGTYHSMSGVATVEQIADFLAKAKAPGHEPKVDIQVPRPPDFLIRAEGIYERAVDKAQRQNRKLLIVFKWWLDADSNELLRRMMRPEVASRCTESINCVLDWDYIPNRAHVAQYGVEHYPAIIAVNRDGSFEVLRGLHTVEEIVAFLTRAGLVRTG